MITLFPILISTSLVSLVSFFGLLILSLKEKFLERIILFLVSFSAGALIGGAFFTLNPKNYCQGWSWRRSFIGGISISYFRVLLLFYIRTVFQVAPSSR